MYFVRLLDFRKFRDVFKNRDKILPDFLRVDVQPYQNFLGLVHILFDDTKKEMFRADKLVLVAAGDDR